MNESLRKQIKEIDNLNELKEIDAYLWERIKALKAIKTAVHKANLSVGDTVILEGIRFPKKAESLRGCVGKIIKIRRTKAEVKFPNDFHIWTVPLANLVLVEGE